MFGFIKKSLKGIVKKFEKSVDKKEVDEEVIAQEEETEKKTTTKPKKTEDKIKKE